MTQRDPVPDQCVVLWRCPACGGVDTDTSQKARYCGRTRKCASASRATGLVKMTPMERVTYVPIDSLTPDENSTKEDR